MISAVVPAKDEERTVAQVVSQLKSSHFVSEVIVVDHASVDQTGAVALAAGARVVRCDEPGLGNAMKAGIRSATSDAVLRTDADIADWDPRWVEILVSGGPVALSRGYFDTPNETFPVTNLVVGPLFDLYCPQWKSIPRPLSGTYLLDRQSFDVERLPGNWAVDIAILTNALMLPGSQVRNVDLGVLVDRQRPIQHYIPMARDITEYIVNNFVRHRKF